MQDHIDAAYIRKLGRNFCTEDDNGLVDFAHMSAIDYLRSTNHQAGLDGFSLLDCNTEMMHSCLYFVRSLPGCGGRTPTAVAQALRPRLGTLPGNWIEPFLKYAFWNWQAHCAAVSWLSDQSDSIEAKLARGILANDEWSESLRIWYDIFSNYSALDQGHDQGHRYEIWQPFRPTLVGPIAPLPGLFMASVFCLVRLIEHLKDYSSYQARDALDQFSDGQCIISAVDPFYLRIFRQVLSRRASAIERSKLIQASSQAALFVQTLLKELNACADLRDNMGETPAMRLSRSLRDEDSKAVCEIYEVLFKHGANINAWNMHGETVLHRAIAVKSTSLIVWLIDHGADIDFRLANGKTPLEQAVSFNSYGAFCQLLERGVSHKAAFRHSTIWHVATKFQFSLDFAAQIDSLSKDVASTDITGWSPLMQAVYHGSTAWTDHLLRQSTYIGWKADKKRALAFVAATREPKQSVEYSDLTIAELFIYLHVHDVSFNVCDERGITPLMLAVSRCDVPAVYCLLRLGCDVHVPDSRGRTAFRYTFPSYNEQSQWSSSIGQNTRTGYYGNFSSMLEPICTNVIMTASHLVKCGGSSMDAIPIR